MFFSSSRWISAVGCRPAPLTFTGLRFGRNGASVLRNYESRPSISSLVFPRFLVCPRGVQNAMSVVQRFFWPCQSHLSLLFVSMISRTLFFSRIHGAVLRSLHVMFSMILSRALCIVLSFKAFCFVRFQVSDPKVTIVRLTDRKPDLWERSECLWFWRSLSLYRNLAIRGS